MGDPTTIGYEAEEHDVDGLLHLVCGDILDEADWLVRYTALTSMQAKVDALVGRIKAERRNALSEGRKAGLGLRDLADATGIGSYQRVQQLLQS